MAHVVTDNCIKCKYMDCVEVCPVDCFYIGENMLVIVSLRWRPPSVEIGFGGEIALTSAHKSALKSCSWPIPFC